MKNIFKTRFMTVISRESGIVGNLFFTGTLKIEGRVDGSIEESRASDRTRIRSKAIVDKGAFVCGKTISAHTIDIRGQVVVDKIWAEDMLIIRKTAVFAEGTKVYYRYFNIECGAQLNGVKFIHLDKTSVAEEI